MEGCVASLMSSLVSFLVSILVSILGRVVVVGMEEVVVEMEDSLVLFPPVPCPLVPSL